MDRRSFLFVFSLGGLSAPLAADAQPTGKVYRIGYLGMGSATVSPPFVEAFREGLRELGLVEGQNIVIDYRFAEGRFDRLPDLAAELVRLRVDVIMAGPTPPAVAAQNATGTIPIVVAGVGDPVELALIVVADGMFMLHRTRLADLAAKSRVPSMHGVRENVEAGGLMSYGPSTVAAWRRAAFFVDRILKGAKPADLPVEQPTKFELVINLKTAKEL